MRKIIFIFLLLSLCACNEELVSPNTLDAEIERIVNANIVMGQTPGAAIGIIKNGIKRTYNFGVQNLESKETFNEFTICEIGSISKTFTALLYAQLAQKNLIDLSNPANQHLPANLQLPKKNNVPVSVLHLLNHTSGLEENPKELSSINPNITPQPFDYSEDKMAAYLSQTELKTEPGKKWSYSNTGMGLLGRMLREITGKQVTELYKENIFQVLGMQYSFSNNTEKPASNVAQGYMGKKAFDFFEMSEVLQSAGCIKSNVHDMLLYLERLLDTGSPIASTLALTKQSTFLRKETLVIAGKNYKNLSQGLGWGKLQNEKGEWIYTHTGGTFGFTSFIAFNETQQTGVVLLYNTGQAVDISSAGFEILSRLEKY
mgnify:CR=1 FL=1